MRGSLRLGFDCEQGQTRLTERAHEPPLQVIRAFDLPGGAALIHLHNTSGGILGGDVLALAVRVGPGAQAQLTTIGATRLYRGDETATQTTQATVAEGATLEYLPDPVIPFAGSRFRQVTRIELAADAGLFWWETLAPGRAARGEVFSYERWESRLDITALGHPIAQERVCLDPARQRLSSPARLGPYRYSCTFYICRVGVPPADWLALEARLSTQAAALTHDGQTLWGVSALPAHGLSVRGLSVTGRELPAGLVAFWRTAKQELYGHEIIVPRKVY